VGTQFLRPIETAVLDGDNCILDFDVDTGAMDFSFVNPHSPDDILFFATLTAIQI